MYAKPADPTDEQNTYVLQRDNLSLLNQGRGRLDAFLGEEIETSMLWQKSAMRPFQEQF